MLSKLINKSKLQKGFTIIEVMIVLAIAGLILVVVLLAIPQLQRNQRNEARRSAGARIVTEINNFSGNNNGVYPLAAVGTGVKNFGNARMAATFMGRYMGCVNPANATTPADCTANIDDPRTGFPMGSGEDGLSNAASGNNITVASNPTAGGTPGTESGDIYYATTAICDGETAVGSTGGATGRNFAFIVRLEGGAGYCLDNK